MQMLGIPARFPRSDPVSNFFKIVRRWINGKVHLASIKNQGFACAWELRSNPLRQARERLVEEALGLTIALPLWFLANLTTLTRVGLDSLAIGLPILASVGCLAAGVAIGIRNGNWPLFWFLSSAVVSHVLAFLAGLHTGALEGSLLHWSLLGFLALQVGLLSCLVFQLKKMRRAAVLISVFFLIYALHAAFISGMAFGDRWI